MTFQVKLPPPPSANNLFVNAVGRGRVRSARYKAWRKDAVLSIYAQVPAPKRIAGPVVVFIALPSDTRSDADNNIKPILDALVDSRRIDDDRNVVSVTASKTIAGKDAFITVSAYGAVAA